MSDPSLKYKMNSELLSEWDILALQESVRQSISEHRINVVHGNVLLRKLEKCSSIQIRYTHTKE